MPIRSVNCFTGIRRRRGQSTGRIYKMEVIFLYKGNVSSGCFFAKAAKGKQTWDFFAILLTFHIYIYIIKATLGGKMEGPETVTEKGGKTVKYEF